MDMDDCIDCSCDNLEIYDGDSTNSPLIQRLCGSFEPPRELVFLSSGTSMYVVFNSDSSMQLAGFEAEYSADICKFTVKRMHVISID